MRIKKFMEIHLDGPDRAGKDTLRHEITRALEGNCVIYDRSYLTVLAYALIYDRRDIDKEMIWSLITEVCARSHVRYFILGEDPEVLVQRGCSNAKEQLRAFEVLVVESNRRGVPIKVLRPASIIQELLDE